MKRVQTAVNNVMYPAMCRVDEIRVRRDAGKAAGEHVIKRKLNGNTYGIAPIT